jgi:2-dehydropantoate 2-reductase
MMLIVGAGAVGTVLAGHLARRGSDDLALYAREKDRAAWAHTDEVRVYAPDGKLRLGAPLPKLVPDLSLEGVEYLVLCVKFAALESLVQALRVRGPIPPSTTIVSTLNGVEALRLLRERLTGARIVPASIMFNAQQTGTLQAQLTTRAAVVLGGEPDEKLAGLFAAGGMKVQHVRGDEGVWGKLLINLANAICAVTHTSFDQLLTRAPLRRAYAAVVEEAVAALDAAGIAYQWPMPVPPAAFSLLLRHGGRLPWWMARAKNGLRQGSYPSMVADVEHGRPTEVRQLNGEIVRVAAQHGLAAPRSARLVQWVETIGSARPPVYLDDAQLAAGLRA